MKPLNVILAVVGGAVAGATVGLLLAPKKGTDTREDIIKCIREKKKLCKKNRKRLEKLAEEIEEEIDNKL